MSDIVLRVGNVRVLIVALALALAGATATGCGDDRAPARLDATAATTAAVTDAAATAPPMGGNADAAAAAPPALVCPPCEPDPPEDVVEVASGEKLSLAIATFDELPGWADDPVAEAVPAFLASCARLAELGDDARVGVDPFSGRARHWRRACAAAAEVPAGDDDAARRFFERSFVPYLASGAAGPDGKFTGYYVEALNGSRTRHGAYQTPLYGRPPDLASIDLERFIPDAKARRLWGRLDPATGELSPYPTRAEIHAGALAGKGLEILWVDDPIDALFAQIQGSGKATLDDGTVQWLEFAGKNGRPYSGVGRILRDLGELQQGEGTMDGIRGWFEAHRDRFDEIANQNRSFVFFAPSRSAGAIGSQKVVLTPRRSVAVDRAFVAASTPLWVDTHAPRTGKPGDAPWRRLMIAQDTGGGIKGAVRADMYWGDDAEAAALGGRTGGKGRYWLLLPRGLDVKTTR